MYMYVMVKWWGQISQAGFQSLKSLYFWYVAIEINDFLNFEFEFEYLHRFLMILFYYGGKMNS